MSTLEDLSESFSSQNEESKLLVKLEGMASFLRPFVFVPFVILSAAVQ